MNYTTDDLLKIENNDEKIYKLAEFAKGLEALVPTLIKEIKKRDDIIEKCLSMAEETKVNINDWKENLATIEYNGIEEEENNNPNDSSTPTLDMQNVLQPDYMKYFTGEYTEDGAMIFKGDPMDLLGNLPETKDIDSNSITVPTFGWERRKDIDPNSTTTVPTFEWEKIKYE